MTIVENKSLANRPDLFRYHDYRKFLRDWLAYQKKEGTGSSLRALARQAGLSCAYLPTVFAGKRRLSNKALAKILPLLGMNAREREFLELLVCASDGETPGERADALEQIQRFKVYRKTNPRESEVFQYLTKWFYVALKEMAALPDFQRNPDWIQGKLRSHLSQAQVRLALSFLFEKGFLEEKEDGSVKAIEKEIRCIGEVFGPALRAFHHQMFAVCLSSLDESPADSHLVLGHTMAISAKHFPEVREILGTALKQIELLGQREKEADTLYHVGILAAPLTK